MWSFSQAVSSSLPAPRPPGRIWTTATFSSPGTPSQARWTRPSAPRTPARPELDLGGRDDVGAIAVGYLGTANNVSGEGNLIVSGSRDGQFAAVALRSDGHLDTRFSGDGILTTNIFGHATGLFTTGDYVAPVRRFVMAGDGGNVARYVDVGSHRSAAHLNNWRTIISRSETVFGDMPSSVSFFLSAR